MKESYIDKIKTMIASNGGWSSIFSKYHVLSDALEKAGANNNSQVPCPFTGQGKTKFRFITKENAYETTGKAFHEDEGFIDGFEIVSRLEGKTLSETLKVIDAMLGGVQKVTPAMKRQYEKNLQEQKELEEREIAKRNIALNNVAKKCTHITENEGVMNYLRKRGLKGDFNLLPNCLYAHSMLMHISEDKERSFWPALIGAVTNSDYETTTLHRHYVTPQGLKAPVDMAKKMMMPNVKNMAGGSIKLDAPAYIQGKGLLGVCEGLETALAVREATGMPMWCGIDANKMRAMDIPDDVTTIFIWGDHDRSKTGVNVSNDLKERLEKEVPGRLVKVLLPDELDIPTKAKSVDWLDVYFYLGAEYFPVYIRDPNYAVKTGVPLPSTEVAA
mgnify:CR=1 FL=1